MTIDNKITDKKVKCRSNIKAAKLSALLSGKIYKYAYLSGEEVVQSQSNSIISQI